MKDIDDMRIGESFYLKMTVAVISTRNGKPCEFDEERIDINDLIIAELEKIKEKINSEDVNCQYEDDYVYSSGLQKAIELIDNSIKELKGEQE